MTTERQREARKWMIALALFCVLLFGAIAWLICGPPTGSRSHITGDSDEKNPAAVRYTIVKEEDQDIPIKTEILQHIVVEGVPTKGAIEAELMNRYRTALARRGFRYYNPATSIGIYIYASKEQALAGQGLWIGMLDKSPPPSSGPQTFINEERLAALTQPSEDRFGLTEATRKHVFWEESAAEHTADYEAMVRTRNVPGGQHYVVQHHKVEEQLYEKYTAEVACHYKISKDQLGEIVVEGVKKGWVAAPKNSKYLEEMMRPHPFSKR